MIKQRAYFYVRCKKSKDAKVQVLAHGYVVYHVCLYCCTITHSEAKERARGHYELFRVFDKSNSCAFAKHIQQVTSDPDKYRISWDAKLKN